MALYRERQRLQAQAQQEAAGESFWTRQLSETVRTKLSHVVQSHVFESQLLGLLGNPHSKLALELGRQEGISIPLLDREYIAACADSDLFFSILEACHEILELPHHREEFRTVVNQVLDAHRVDFQLVGDLGQIVPRSSFELHSSIVAPAVQLLHSSGGFSSVEAAYTAALKEIGEGNPGDAITDAATALQEMFKALEVEGATLGDQVRNAKNSGKLHGRDTPLSEGIEKALNWASSERNQNSDAHKVTAATLDDAWFMVHVVGALIVRLAGSPRS